MVDEGVGPHVDMNHQPSTINHQPSAVGHWSAEATLYERVRWEIDTLGLSLTAHPTRLFRAQLAPFRPVPASRLGQQPDGARVATAGIVVCRMRPRTKSGAVVVFITLEDETGLIDTVIFPRVYDLYGKAAFASDLLVIQGRIQRQGKYGATLIATRVINPLEGLVEDRIDGKTGLAKETLDELPAFTFAPEVAEEDEEDKSETGPIPGLVSPLPRVLV
jgi:DNA polymerase III alpha subunit